MADYREVDIKELQPYVVSPKTVCHLLSIGLTRCYELINNGELVSFNEGKSRKIMLSSVKAYVARKLQEEVKFSAKTNALLAEQEKNP